MISLLSSGPHSGAGSAAGSTALSAASAASAATASRRNWRGGGRRGLLDAVGHVALDSCNGGLPVSRRESVALDEGARGRDQLGEPERVGTLVSTGERVSKFIAQSLAPLR